MTPAARVQAAIDCLEQILDGAAAEQVLTAWARKSRFAGSKDRAALRDLVFDVLRRRQSCAAQGGAGSARALLLGLLRADGQDLQALFDGTGYGPSPLSAAEQAHLARPAALSGIQDMPDWLFALLQQDHPDQAEQICATLRHRAPVTLRARRPDAADLLAQEGIGTEPVPGIATALRVVENPRKLRGSQAYAQGVVEIQDAGAQALCAALPLTENARVLDMCAGGGGKILALADRMKIEAYAYDIDPKRMSDLPARAARAGQQITRLDDPAAQAPYDLVLCDVPCSGSGTWRRTPEAKWRLTPERLAELTQIQQQILTQAADLTAPGGVLAYATCSVLACENDQVIRQTLDQRPDLQLRHSALSLPSAQQDGFFLAMLDRAR